MKAFEYAAPATAELAVKALERPESVALSGGTDILGRMKDHVTNPDRVVYLKDIKSLAGIEPGADGGMTIGAGTLLASILANKELSDRYPALWQAALEVGTPQIKNMATLGGNLLQRPRCWYFRAGYGLLPKKDGKNLVREGDNRYHAIFLNDGDALFVNPSSLAVPLIALGAKATILGAKGERTVPIESLYQIPKKEGDRELTIAPGELLTKVTIPASNGKNASYEVRQKQAHDWPLVMASVNLSLDGPGVVGNGRIVLYGVAPIPYRCEAAERASAGKPINPETATAAAIAAIEGAKPLSKNGYKVALTKTVVKRALLTAVGNRYWEET
jgi:xanthine dehydrogenase YagS FAD-binding subunit